MNAALCCALAEQLVKAPLKVSSAMFTWLCVDDALPCKRTGGSPTKCQVDSQITHTGLRHAHSQHVRLPFAWLHLQN